eukprot:scaffold1868_cov193-Cylindrotheca_fusiformis.AAC.19
MMGTPACLSNQWAGKWWHASSGSGHSFARSATLSYILLLLGMSSGRYIRVVFEGLHCGMTARKARTKHTPQTGHFHLH